MVTATNTLINSQTGSLDFSAKVSKTDNFSDKVTSEVYKADNKKTYEKPKSEEFKEVLNSKSNYKDGNTKKVNDNNDQTKTEDISKIDELKEKLKELEKDSDKVDSKDKVEDILSQLLALLNKLGVKEEDLKSNGEINSENLKNLIEALSEKNSSKNNAENILQKLVELMKNDSVKDSLDTEALKSIKDILSKLSANLVDDNTKAAKDMKSGIKNLMSEISNVLESKQNQNAKVLTLEDMLNNKYSQDKKDGALGDESSKNTASEGAKTNKETSKENKFLNSLLDDNKDSSMNKINLFASRSQVIQNQNGDTVRGLTINKATFANDLIKDVKFMSTSAMKELTVKVNPGDIGEITIKLIQEDGVMKANLKANSKEATALLSQNLADIKKQLNEQNIKIADVNIELYQDDTTFFSEQGFGGQLAEEQGKNNNTSNNRNRNYMTMSEDDLTDDIVTNDNNIEFFA